MNATLLGSIPEGRADKEDMKVNFKGRQRSD